MDAVAVPENHPYLGSGLSGFPVLDDQFLHFFLLEGRPRGNFLGRFLAAALSSFSAVHACHVWLPRLVLLSAPRAGLSILEGRSLNPQDPGRICRFSGDCTTWLCPQKNRYFSGMPKISVIFVHDLGFAHLSPKGL